MEFGECVNTEPGWINTNTARYTQVLTVFPPFEISGQVEKETAADWWSRDHVMQDYGQ